MDDLKAKAVRGGFAKLCGQVANFALRIASVAILARLLDPEDFGLVAMATVVTGVYGLFSTAGLSSATVQQATITDEQISTLFWINLAVGILLALLSAASASALVAFYHEPRLYWVTIAIGFGFVLNGAGVQHSALLERQLRYVALTVIDLVSQIGGIVVALWMALAGLGYWALVAAAIVSPAISTVCVWLTTAWIPGAPRWGRDTLPMLRFGGTITLNSLIVYVAYNFDKILLGRFWGAEALGIYGRAYQLVTIPTSNLNSAVGGVSFSALSRLQHDPDRLRNYFLKGYSLVVSLTIPTTIFCAMFSNDIVLVILGPKWMEAAMIFRLLAPTVLIFGMINPLGWLLFVRRSDAKKPGDRVGHRSVGDIRLFHWAAVWPEGRCNCLFDCDDAVGGSPYSLVPARNGDFALAPAPGGKSSVPFRSRSCRDCFCRPAAIRAVGVTLREIGNRGQHNA